MNLQLILRTKGTEIFSVAPDSSVEDVVQALIDNNCGSMVVLDPNSSRPLEGIITERDIIKITGTDVELCDILVSKVMSTDVITGLPSDSVAEVMGLMTRKRIRHLPVVENNKLLGLISIGDVVKAQFDELAMENHYLKTYIQG
ncbi:MAG: CBS domain-containing protein [Planctomycetales bacterium]